MLCAHKKAFAVGIRRQSCWVQARLSHAEAYQEDFGYLSYPPEHYNVPFYIDPTATDGLTGMTSTPCVDMHVPVATAPGSWSADPRRFCCAMNATLLSSYMAYRDWRASASQVQV